MVSVDIENRQVLRAQSWLLAARVAVVSIGIMLIPDARVSIATLFGIFLTATIVSILLVRRDCWLPYCYLGAAALWAGYGASLCIDGESGAIFLFIACLIVVDASGFVFYWKKQWL